MPWEDLRYLFGEIMYGGHITDDWDRRLCRTYLLVFMDNEMVSLCERPECVKKPLAVLKNVLSMEAGCSPTGKKVKLETYFRDSSRDFWDLQESQLA